MTRSLFTRGLLLLPAVAVAALMARPATASADDDERKGEPMAARVFKLEHQSAESVARALRNLGSGQREAKMEASDSLDTITVRDRPANVTAIEQAIKQLDVARPDVTVQIRVLLAGPDGVTSVPTDMQKVVKQLQQNLQFKAYHQVTAITHRIRSGAQVESRGSIQLAPPAFDKSVRVGYELELRPVVSPGIRRGGRTIQLRGLRFEIESRDTGKAEVDTDVVIPEGEIVVVGTAALGARALVLVVWASTTP